MILAWLGALLVGLSLGLLGSGGSILTVPILIYLIGEEKKVAIAESLGIVAAISASGLVMYAVNKQVHWKSVVLFGIPGMIGAFLGASFSQYVSASVQLVIFGIIMCIAAVMMFRNGAVSNETKVGSSVWWILSLEGLAVGVLTGLIGIGGGFLIVPALVLLAGLSMKFAVGTSLTIIVMQSTAGFITQLNVLAALNKSVDVELMLIFALIGAAGSLVGRTIGSRISNQKLKKVFALFLIVMGIYIIYMNSSFFYH